MASGYDLPPETPGFAEAQAEMSALSAPAGELPGVVLDVPYGAHPRQRLDIFPAGPDAPVLIFYRGGYWRVGNKEDRRFPASEWLSRGVSWVVPNYRLAPDASLPDIVDDARAAFAWVIANGAAHGLDPTRLHLVGNSAGAHLSAMVASGPDGDAVRSMTLISGLFDLEPLRTETANDWLRLDADTAHMMSPTHHLPSPDVPVTVCCGGAETDAFLTQSRDYADRLRANGNTVEHFESPDKNHMQIILECGEPGSPVFEAQERYVLPLK
ncbi:MAG: alpha/beta hydrolase [Paracoccaceae bacterium]